jgi:hypothetical protein
MTKRIPLDRLRDISKQRSIRSPQVLQRGSEQTDERERTEPNRIEWPLPS